MNSTFHGWSRFCSAEERTFESQQNLLPPRQTRAAPDGSAQCLPTACQSQANTPWEPHPMERSEKRLHVKWKPTWSRDGEDQRPLSGGGEGTKNNRSYPTERPKSWRFEMVSGHAICFHCMAWRANAENKAHLTALKLRVMEDVETVSEMDSQLPIPASFLLCWRRFAPLPPNAAARLAPNGARVQKAEDWVVQTV